MSAVAPAASREDAALLASDAAAKMDVSKVIDQKARIEGYIASLKDMPADSPLKQCIAVTLKYGAKPLIAIFMAYVWIARKLYALYQILPHNILQMIFGVGLCFFGGVYFTSIAAVEALINFGGAQLYEELSVMYQEGCEIQKASAEDDKVDANKDGIVDVNQMSHSELLNHKAAVAMVSVKDPKRLMKAVEFMMTAYLSVIATLKFEFAKTIALCLGIATMLEVPLCRIFAPVLAMAMGPNLNHWVETVVMTTAKVIAIIVATFVQSTISAFYSGIRGGKLFATGLINFLGANGIMDKLPCIAKPFDADKSYFDECLAYPLAAVGFYYQITSGFTLPFPWNLILLPCTIVEWILRWQVFFS